MCMVSNIGDGWRRTLPEKYPWLPEHFPHYPYPENPVPVIPFQPSVSREEIEQLRKEMEELRKLLEAAKKFDEKTGQPHCEVDEKVAVVKAVAKMVGVELGDVFDEPKGR